MRWRTPPRLRADSDRPLNTGSWPHSAGLNNLPLIPVWSKNSADVEVPVCWQAVIHNCLNSQATDWTQECRYPSQHEARLTFRSLQVTLSTSDSTRPPSIRDRHDTRDYGSNNAVSRPVVHDNALVLFGQKNPPMQKFWCPAML